MTRATGKHAYVVGEAVYRASATTQTGVVIEVDDNHKASFGQIKTRVRVRWDASGVKSWTDTEWLRPVAGRREVIEQYVKNRSLDELEILVELAPKRLRELRERAAADKAALDSMTAEQFMALPEKEQKRIKKLRAQRQEAAPEEAAPAQTA